MRSATIPAVMSAPRSRPFDPGKLHPIFAAVLGVAALVPIFRLLSVAFARVGHPFELEWMESAVLDHIRIVLEGQPLYREPSIEFAPLLYAPFYYYVSALFAKIVGIGFFAPRLVSLLSIMGCLVVMADWVRRETGDWAAGLATAGLFAATYPLTGYWFDIARADSLFLLLVLSGYALARFGVSRTSVVLCGVLLALATLTKQVGLVLAVPPLVYRVVRSWRSGALASAVFFGVLAAISGWLEASSHGWFSFYVLRVPMQHDVAWNNLPDAFKTYLWSPVAPMVLCVLAVAVRAVVGRAGIGGWLLYALFPLMALDASMSSLLKVGGYPNGLMPTYAALAVSSGLVMGKLRSTLGKRLLVLAVFALQIGQLWYERGPRILPSRADVEAGRHLLAVVAASPGPVWVMSSGYYPYAARNAPVMAHAMGLVDILRSKDGRVTQKLEQHLVDVIRSKRFRTIVVDRAWGFLPSPIPEEIQARYRLKERIFRQDDRALWPKVGADVRPDELWTPAGP